MVFLNLFPNASVFASLLLFSSSINGQSLNKPVLFKDGLSPHVDNVFFQHLSPTHSTWDKWGWGWIPQACQAITQSKGLSPYDIEVYDVHYDDCDSAFIICRHNRAQMSVIQMIDAFGRMPIHDRQWTQHILALPASSCSAGTGGAVTTFYGPCYIPSVFVHEFTHTLDAFANDKTGADNNIHVYSTTSPYRQAIAKDSCVPDSYANTSPQEDYAQVSVLALYEKVNPGGLDPIGPWRCLVNSKNNLDSIIGSELTPGGTCNRRWADSLIVCMGPAAGCISKRSDLSRVAGKTRGPKPKPANKKGDKLVSDITPKLADAVSAKVHSWGNLVSNQTASVEATRRINAWNSAVGKQTVPVPKI
ncbi:hypothetical protein BGZ63DRAFT_423228 [Mariannaea sp. PMI_226]|nr:hypothetical protein BGZ63DRAFT_423228 [Mariannaea sp. PMI_226]